MESKTKKTTGKNSTVKIVGAAVAGAAVGAALGILFAPDKGSATRKKITNGAKDLTNDLKEKINLGKNHTTEKA